MGEERILKLYSVFFFGFFGIKKERGMCVCMCVCLNVITKIKSIK